MLKKGLKNFKPPQTNYLYQLIYNFFQALHSINTKYFTIKVNATNLKLVKRIG